MYVVWSGSFLKFLWCSHNCRVYFSSRNDIWFSTLVDRLELSHPLYQYRERSFVELVFFIKKSLHPLLKSTSQSTIVDFFFSWFDFSLGIAFTPFHKLCSAIMALPKLSRFLFGPESLIKVAFARRDKVLQGKWTTSNAFTPATSEKKCCSGTRTRGGAAKRWYFEA